MITQGNYVKYYKILFNLFLDSNPSMFYGFLDIRIEWNYYLCLHCQVSTQFTQYFPQLWWIYKKLGHKTYIITNLFSQPNITKARQLNFRMQPNLIQLYPMANVWLLVQFQFCETFMWMVLCAVWMHVQGW